MASIQMASIPGRDPVRGYQQQLAGNLVGHLLEIPLDLRAEARNRGFFVAEAEEDVAIGNPCRKRVSN